MAGLLLVAAPLCLVAVLLAGCALAGWARRCLVCDAGLAWHARRLEICAPCWAEWQAAVAGHYQDAWQAALGRAYRRGLWGPALQWTLARDLRAERRTYDNGLRAPRGV